MHSKYYVYNAGGGGYEFLEHKNSVFNEQVIRLYDDKTKLYFPSRFKNSTLLAVHTWNNGTCLSSSCYTTYSSLIIKNKEKTIIKNSPFIRLVVDIQEPFKIDEQSFCYYNCRNLPYTEGSHSAISWQRDSAFLPHIDLVDFFLAKDDGDFGEGEFNQYNCKDINPQIPKEYNFDHLIPPIELYKEIIDEYCTQMDPIKLAPLQNQINELKGLNKNLNSQLNSLSHQKQIQELENLKFDTNIKKLQVKKLEKELGLKLSELEPKLIVTQDELNSAKARVHKHLAYKLGQALIINSKSFFGYLRMPFILSYIKAQHHFELKKYQNAIAKNPNLKLPPLETYADYKEALQEKQCLTYKLGLALMEADKTWYKGGYVKFYFESKRLKREFKGKG